MDQQINMKPRFSFRVPGGITDVFVENRHWRIDFTFEPFPGAHVTMEEEMEGKPFKNYAGRIEDILNCGMIMGWRKGVVGRGCPTDDVYHLDSEELQLLKDIQRVITWAQDNTFWVDVGNNPQLAEMELLGPAPSALDAELSVSPV